MEQERSWLQRLTDAFNEKSVAHLSIDLQEFYCDPKHPRNRLRIDKPEVYRSEALIDKVAGFVNANRQSLTTIWVAHNCASAYGVPPAHAKAYLPQLARESFHLSLPVNDNDPVICKKNYSAFDKTDLDGILKEKNIKTLLLSGVFLDMCVYDTAEAARKLDYDVYILRGLVAHTSSAQASERLCFARLKNELGIQDVSPKLVSKIAAGKFSLE